MGIDGDRFGISDNLVWEW